MKENAYITLLTTDNYIYYVIGLFESWKVTNSKYKLYCAITNNISKKTLKILEIIGMPYFYIDIEPLQPFIKRSQKLGMVNKYQQASNKLALLGLTQFNKCVYLDSDMLVFHNIDDLFEKPDFSSVEDCAPVHFRPEEYSLGESAFCAGMFVFSPSTKLYNDILELANTLPTNIKWNDQNILAYYLRNWMKKSELHLPCEYEINIAGKENVYNTYLDFGGKDKDIKIKHYVTYKNAPFNKTYYMRDSVYSEYIKYYNFINDVIKKYNLGLELVHIENLKKSFNIDLVVPYVDNTDPNWQEAFYKYKTGIEETTQTTATMRFRSQDNFFRYFFRAIEKNMPWINNIHLLVMSESQVPTWLDTTKVRVVTHEQFIPKEYLPTFNSSVIELFLHNIPGLAEHFIYANDDFYAWSKMTQDQFFNLQSNTCLFNVITETKDPTTSHAWWQMCQNNHDLIYKTTKAIPYFRLDHEFRPYLKSLWTACFNENKQNIYNSLSRFRETKNYTCYLYSLYLLKHNKQAASNLKLGYLASNASTKTINNVLHSANMLCVNDTADGTNIYENESLRKQFKLNFNFKSKYELNDYQDTVEVKPNEVISKQANSRADGQSNYYLYF